MWWVDTCFEYMKIHIFLLWKHIPRMEVALKYLSTCLIKNPWYGELSPWYFIVMLV